MSDSSFNANFYLAVAAAIPVLWITVGLATDVITRIIIGLRNDSVSFKIGGISYSISSTGITLSLPAALAIGFTLVPYGPNIITGAFFVFLTLSGAAGEVLCAFALFFQNRNAIMAYVTLSCLLMLILLTSVILIVSLFAAAAKAFADQPSGRTVSGGE